MYQYNLKFGRIDTFFLYYSNIKNIFCAKMEIYFYLYY